METAVLKLWEFLGKVQKILFDPECGGIGADGNHDQHHVWVPGPEPGVSRLLQRLPYPCSGPAPRWGWHGPLLSAQN